jgi:hypothetical protein
MRKMIENAVRRKGRKRGIWEVEECREKSRGIIGYT